jgi:HSP20 family protein
MKELQKQETELQNKAEHTRERRLYTPQVDIIEKKNEMLLIADMAGVDEHGLDITIEKRTLSIHGTIDAGTMEGQRPIFSEYGIGDYQRSFTLSDEVDKDRIQATIKNGVLRLIMPKSDANRTKKIPVAAGV